MSDSSAPNRPSFADQLPAGVYYHLIHTLCLALPPPLTDSPEDLARRNHAAIAALHPANAAEANIAALHVAASEQCKGCFRLAHQPEMSPEWAMKCRAQANTMMRQAQSWLRLLLRIQARRQKTEADSEARDRAAQTEHCAINLMAQALSPQAAPAPIAEPPAPPPASHPQPEPEPAKQPQPRPPRRCRPTHRHLPAHGRADPPDGASARQHLLLPARRRFASIAPYRHHPYPCFRHAGPPVRRSGHGKA